MTPERQQFVQRVVQNRRADITIVLDQLQDVHNIYAILRTCDAMGASDVYLLDPKNVLPKQGYKGKKIAKSARKWVQIHQFKRLQTLIDDLRSKGFYLIASSLNSTSTSYHQTIFDRPTALILGNETDGVSEEMLQASDAQVHIPMLGAVESLNVSVAAGVLLSEVLRQKQLESTLPKQTQQYTHHLNDLYSGTRKKSIPVIKYDTDLDEK